MISKRVLMGLLVLCQSGGKNYLQHGIHSGLPNFVEEKQTLDTASKSYSKHFCSQLKNEAALTKSGKWNLLSYDITSQIENSCLKTFFFFTKLALPLHFTCTIRLPFPFSSPHLLLKVKENKSNIRK